MEQSFKILRERIEAQRKEIQQLNNSKDWAEYLLIGEKNKNKVLSNWLVTAKEEKKALLGVIDGMKITIKNLEDERNRQNNNTN